MPNESAINFKPKRWHQKWWGVFFLVIMALVLSYGAALLFEVVKMIEAYQQQLPTSGDMAVSQNNEIRKVAETSDDPYWGPANADIVIVEFSDFQCPYCAQEFSNLKKIRQEYQSKVKIIYRDMPNIVDHDQALGAAMAAECADEQGKFWPYHDLLFANQANLSDENFKLWAGQIKLKQEQFDNCLDSQKYKNEVLNDLAEGLKLNITGTPTFFVNGNMAAGVITYEQFKELLDKALEIQKK